MDLIASMVAVVLGFPPAIMIGMLAMDRVERHVTKGGDGLPPLRLVHGETTAPEGGTVAMEPGDHATPPGPALRLVPAEETAPRAGTAHGGTRTPSRSLFPHSRSLFRKTAPRSRTRQFTNGDH